jgi:predicted metal-dependent enzyme (double-stranded beta helix superfamily)
MDAPPEGLSLDAFICAMGRGTACALTHERLLDVVARLRLSDALIASHTCFAKDQYARNLVCRTPTFELLVLCWRPGHASTIHDHAGSLNAISVHRGELTSRVFAPRADAQAGAGPVELTAEQRIQPGEGLVGVDRDGIHQLANTCTEDLVTVHVYAPALMALNVYSTASSQVERRPLRYSLADDLA